MSLEITPNKPLKALTWMKVGGNAEWFAEPSSREELQEAFAFAKRQDLPLICLGQGSNMIVPDEGFRGMVIRLQNDQVDWHIGGDSESVTIHSEGGLVLTKLIRDARKKGLNGLNNFVGIPGTVGAAVRGNIGIPKEEFGELVSEVECFDGERFFWVKQADCDFRYRGSQIKDLSWVVWSVKLKVRKGESPEKDDWLLERIAKQPKGHSCGSFFKNPDPKNGVYAGKLIEECGLKGKRIGGAFVSEHHANFLMNDGTGTADEILRLAKEIKASVLEKKGIILENEVLLYDEQGRLIDLT